MQSTAIVVTGMGAVTPVGIGVEDFWQALLAAKCGIGPIGCFDATGLAVQIAAEIPHINPADILPRSLLRQADPFTQYAYLAATQALAGHLPAAPERTGIVMGTAMAGVATIAATQEALTTAVHKNVGPFFVPRVLGNTAAAQIAMTMGIHGPSLTVSTACASGGDAISLAAMLLQTDQADAVVVVGADSLLCPLVLYSLANAHALSRRNDDPLHACRPFDAQRDGFVIGEGGGALVLETQAHALARNAEIFGQLAGWATNNDAYHITAPDPDGTYAAACMRTALQRAGLQPEQIGYINAHGTATVAGDAAEAKAILAVFGAHTPYVSSTKGATGHMMGAGGILEVVICLQALRQGLLPPGLNLQTPEFPLRYVANQPVQQPITAAMSNAFGFGGQNSCVIVRAYPPAG